MERSQKVMTYKYCKDAYFFEDLKMCIVYSMLYTSKLGIYADKLIANSSCHVQHLLIIRISQNALWTYS